MSSNISATLKERLMEQVHKSLENAKLQDCKILFACIFGSRVYGTATNSSDFDLLVVIGSGGVGVGTGAQSQSDSNPESGSVVKTEVDDHGVRFIVIDEPSETKSDEKSGTSVGGKVGVDITIRSLTSFTSSLTAGDPFAVEAICTPEQFVLCSSEEMTSLIKATSLSSTTMLGSIRNGFSAKSAWAEVRARKKFKDGEHLIAIKSQYHSYRILLFAIQIAKKGFIHDWSAGSDYLTVLRTDLEAGKIDDAYLRASYKQWVKESTTQTDGTNMTVASYYKMLLPK
ncbi:hypothetical protein YASMINEVIRUS_112 [Yasminevirus sp. GU-2018]|uniref:Uncharacterized protein n=1 Tax=Yasminevirus sp. GU-2018 TaxID=2420051 RepID=A0A5K0U6S1_9VIRU|nr:hypothetical protein YASMINEVIRUS_112 [Yasminevirus sp. GU-2018]